MSRGLSVIAFAWNDIPQCNSLARERFLLVVN